MGALTTQRGELEQTCFFAADTSRVTLGLDVTCHSQKFKISPLAFSARARECQRVRLAGRRDSKEGRRGLTFSLAHHKPVG